MLTCSLYPQKVCRQDPDWVALAICKSFTKCECSPSKVRINSIVEKCIFILLDDLNDNMCNKFLLFSGLQVLIISRSAFRVKHAI